MALKIIPNSKYIILIKILVVIFIRSTTVLGDPSDLGSTYFRAKSNQKACEEKKFHHRIFYSRLQW